MSEFKDLYNPDFQKYGFIEFEFDTPVEPALEKATPEASASATTETTVSRLKSILKKQK